MNTKAIGKWSYIVGLIIAILAALFSIGLGSLGWILALLGVFAALWYFDSGDNLHTVLLYLGLTATTDALGGIPVIGEFISAIAGGYASFLGPIVLTLMLVKGWKSLTS